MCVCNVVRSEYGILIGYGMEHIMKSKKGIHNTAEFLE
jgi:hypothetical protein